MRVSGDNNPVALGIESRQSINQHLKTKPLTADEVSQEVVELRGSLRAVHLDEDWLEVIVNGNAVRVKGLEDAVDDVIGPMVNRSVVVKARKTPPNKYKFLDVELSE